MPLILDDIDLTDLKSSAIKTIDPKFFSSALTGNGRNKIGLLNQMLQPVNTAQNTAYHADDHIEAKAGSTQNSITVNTIPFAPLTQRALSEPDAAFTLATPHLDDRCRIQTASVDWDIAFDMTPQAAKLYEDKAGGTTSKDFIVQYRMELYFFRKGKTEPERTVLSGGASGSVVDALTFITWDASPLDNAAAFVNDILAANGLTHTNPTELIEWLSNDYNIYDRITRQAEAWNSDGVATEVCAYIAGLPTQPSSGQLNALALQLRYLENYNVPLESYRTIHQKIQQTFDESTAASLSKQNLNLLMSHTLSHLESIKPQLTTPPVPATGYPAIPPHFSNQQRAAITTHEPLTMAVAGAGTGKSSVIIGRINYLESCGVPASDVTVLSFTNAAADNIIERNPNVGSMTIARMINDIYMLNHTTHELSSIDTIINSIDIFFPNSSFAADFRTRLMEVDQNKTGAFTALNTFIELRFDEVINLLDRIRQTSLELEIIICYQKIDTMLEPPHVASKYLIIDEVQDNSIFEFIYVLKYITKHNQSLFIVGDASQTLYEFRSANPRALNTLEGSGVFSTFRLTTNYRSNQEILDFANVALRDLETNQLSNIQLQANSLDMPTAQTFQDKITVDYNLVPKISQFVSESLAGVLRTKVIPDYVKGRIAAGEQVAFLAFSRREVDFFQQELQSAFPDQHVASLVSDKVFATDIFSKYIKKFWDDIMIVKPADASFAVVKGIQDNLEHLTKNWGNDKVRRAVDKMISEWWVENSNVINQWVVLCNQGSVSYAEFFDRLRDNMLSYEIRHNAVRQSLTNQKNRERKQKNADAKSALVISTIHGAKGMEFDNVVVLHKEDPQMSQDKRRMFYVAFTRAMKTQYVLSYGTVKNPPIISNYEQIVNALTERDAQAAARAAGIDPALLNTTDDDDADAPTGANATV